jgi:uncharacterized protein YdaU (DUF1376 family)
MKDKKDKIYYFQEKSNDILDLQDELTIEEIGIYFILKAGYFKYAGELKKENANQRCKFYGDINKFNAMISKLFDEVEGLLVNNSWLSEINGIKEVSKKRSENAKSRWDNTKEPKPNPIPENPKETQLVLKETKPKSKLFIKPTIDEIKDYCLERKNNVNAESFSNYYEARGWKLKGIQMKDWKACVRTWEGNDYNTSQILQPKQTFLTKQQIQEQRDKDIYARLIQQHEQEEANNA